VAASAGVPEPAPSAAPGRPAPHGGGPPVRRGERQRDPASRSCWPWRAASSPGSSAAWRAARLRPRRRPGQGRLRHRREDSMYKLSGVTKNYAKGRETVGRAARGRPGDRGRRMAGHPGPDRARQVDAAADPRRPGPPVRRQSSTSTAVTSRSCARAEMTRVRASSIGFVFQTLQTWCRRCSAQEKRGGRAGPACTRPRPRGGSGPRSPSRPSALGDRFAARGPASLSRRPAAAGSHRPRPSSRSRRSCWPTSRPAIWTRTPGTRSSACSRSCGGSAA